MTTLIVNRKIILHSEICDNSLCDGEYINGILLKLDWGR